LDLCQTIFIRSFAIIKTRSIFFLKSVYTNFGTLKSWLMSQHEQQFADAVAEACLNQYQKLPNTGKPSVNGRKREWTILAGIALVKELPEAQAITSKPKSNRKFLTVDKKQYEITVVSLG
jgi:hypothetical protein